MLSKRQIKSIEKQTTKRLQKHYRPGAYFFIEGAEFMFGDDMDDMFTITARTGYIIEKEGAEDEYAQIVVAFRSSEDVVKNVGEFAAVLYHEIVSALDDYECFLVM